MADFRAGRYILESSVQVRMVKPFSPAPSLFPQVDPISRKINAFIMISVSTLAAKIALSIF